MKGKYGRFYAILGEINKSGANVTKEQIVKDFTGGKTESLTQLTSRELNELERSLALLQSKRPIKKDYSADPLDKPRKAIIAIFKSVGRNTAEAKAWAEKYGVKGVKRKFNDYTGQELIVLIRNAEKMKADYIRSVNKKLV